MLFLLLSAARAAPFTLVVEHLASDQGVVICTLFASEDDWLSTSSFPAVTAKPASGRAECVFQGVRPGRYAATFHQDLNGNGAMDKSWLGLPREPWGVTRDAPARFGPPAFVDAAFELPDAPPPAVHPK